MLTNSRLLQVPLEQVPESLMFKHYATLQKNEYLFRQGQFAGKVFQVNSGFVKIMCTNTTGDEFIVDVLGEGSYYTEWHFIESIQSPHQYSAVTLCDNTRVSAIDVRRLDGNQLERLQTNLLPLILKTLQKFQSREAVLRFGNGEEKIIHTLRSLADTWGRKVGNSVLLQIPLSHEDLALMANCSRQTASSILAGLKRRGLIKYSRGRILFFESFFQQNHK